MRTPELKEFIQQHSNLFWYTPQDKKVEVSDEFLVETILNYGDKDAFIQLINILGKHKVATLFFRSINESERRRGNYSEITIHFFSNVFKKYAH